LSNLAVQVPCYYYYFTIPFLLAALISSFSPSYTFFSLPAVIFSFGIILLQLSDLSSCYLTLSISSPCSLLSLLYIWICSLISLTPLLVLHLLYYFCHYCISHIPMSTFSLGSIHVSTTSTAMVGFISSIISFILLSFDLSPLMLQ